MHKTTKNLFNFGIQGGFFSFIIMRKLLFCYFLAFLLPLASYAQDFSNRGKEFWLAYPGHIDGNNSRMALYISSTVNTSGSVFLPGNNQINFTVTANQASVVQIFPATLNVINAQSEGINTGFGIRIVTNDPVVAYAHVLNAARSGSTLLFPVNTLGREYVAASFASVSNSNPPAGVINGSASGSQFTIVAVEDNTTIEITPTAPDVGNRRSANIPFTITMNRGDVYQYRTAFNLDITGTKIRSLATSTSSCKPIAVFSGSPWAAIGCPGFLGGTNCNASGGDNLFLQMIPKSSWGKEYVTAPFADRPYDIYRVLVDDPATNVTLNGNVLPKNQLVNNSYYQFFGSTPNVISTDKPVVVVQYMVAQNCDPRNNPLNNCGTANPAFPGDPEMVIINPIEQTINDVTVVSARNNLTPPNTNIIKHFFTIIMKTNATGSLRIDGNPPTGNFIPIPNSAYSYLHENVTASTNINPSHRINADSGFVALAYGLGGVESYGYNAGTNVRDLFQFMSVRNQFGNVDFPATCSGTPFKLAITLPYRPTKLNWNLSSLSQPAVDNNAPTPDSSYFLQGRELFVYRLPNNYQMTQKGVYPIKVSVNNPTPDGCSGEQVIDFELNVFDPPTTSMSVSSDGCVGSPVQFTATNNTGGRPVSRYYWDFGDGTSSTAQSPQKTFTQPGKYNIKYTLQTDVGCISDTVFREIEISNVPTPGFSVSNPQCTNNAIAFTDGSSFSGFGTVTNWRWNFDNGTVLNNANNNAVTNTFSNAGSYNVSLQLTTSTGCVSPAFTIPVTVHPLPVPKFSMSYACLPDGQVRFTDESTIANGTQAQFAYRWNFGDPNSGGANLANIANPIHRYSTVGPYDIQLIVTSVNGCVDSVTNKQSNIYPQPKTNFSIPAEVCFQAPVTMQDQTDGITHPVVRWEWRFLQANGTQAGTSTAQNPVFDFPAPGTYTVRHWAFTDQNCVSDTVEKQIVIHPWPTANFAPVNPTCEKNASLFNDLSVANVGNIVRWYWKMGDGTIRTQTTPAQLSHTYTSWGDQNVQLVVENSKGCVSDTFTRTQRIHPLPQPGFVLPEVCQNDVLANFTDTTKIADATTGFTYRWNFNAGSPAVNPGPVPTTSTAKNPIIRFNKAADYIVSVVVASAAGCVDSLSKSFTVNGAVPDANFNILPTNGLCSNRPVEIQNTSTVDFGVVTKVEVYWDFDQQPTVFITDDHPQPNKIYSHQYPNFQSPLTRSFRIRLRAFSGGTCVDEIIKTVVVNASPLTQFNAMPGICLDATPRQITEASELGGLAGTSVFSGPGVNASGRFDPAAAGVGTHTLRYTFTAANACTMFSERTVEVWPRPVSDFDLLLPSCEKNQVAFRDNSTHNATSITTWQWNFGDGSPLLIENSVSNARHIFNQFNDYNVTLQVINNRGCTSIPTTKNITVHPLPRVSFTLPIVCLPEGKAAFANLTALPNGSNNGIQYRWKFGDAAASPVGSDTSILKDPVYNYRNLGNYTVRLIAQTDQQCIDSLDQTVTEVYPQPRASFTSTDSVCIDNAVVFTDRSTGSGRPIQQWKWNFGDGISSALQNPVYLYRNQGAYTASLFVITDKGCLSDTATRSVNVWDYPIANAGPDFTMLQDGVRKISAASASGAEIQILWTPPTWLNDVSLQNPTIVQPQDDITYRMTVTGRGGCTRFDDVFVKILKTPKPPNTFTPNGDGINDFWEIEYLNDYPGCVLEVYNSAGTLLYRSVGYPTPWDGTFKGQKLPAGTYYYVIDPKNGRKRVAGYVTIIR